MGKRAPFDLLFSAPLFSLCSRDLSSKFPMRLRARGLHQITKDRRNTADAWPRFVQRATPSMFDLISSTSFCIEGFHDHCR